MTSNENLKTKTALVTGANSGIGFETAYQLEAAGYGKVVLACRTLEKAESARRGLIARGCKDVFETLAVDVCEAKSAIDASNTALSKGLKIDLLILNAGMVSKDIQKNGTGVDKTFASTLVGHHAMTMNFLAKDGLSDDAAIIIAGSEAAGGGVPGVKLPDIDKVAKEDFSGDLHGALKAFAEAAYPTSYAPMNAYAMAKLFVAWWASSLAEKLPQGMTVYAVSPGGVMSTNFIRNMAWPMRNIMVPFLAAFGPLMGMSGPVSAAGKRYLDVSGYGKEQSGKFFASRAGKTVGKLEEQRTPLLQDAAKRNAAYGLIVELAGGTDVPAATAA